MKVTLVIQADTAIAFRSNRNQNAPDTLDYLPGSTLRGGLAAAHAMMRPQSKDEFNSFFLDNLIQFGNGYPDEFEQPELQNDVLPIDPLPRTALSCKRCPGFLSQQSGDLRWAPHGVRDSLISTSLFSMAPERETHIQGAEEDCGYLEEERAACTEPIERFDGFVRRSNGNAIYGRSKLLKELRTKTGISRGRGAVHEGILYSRRMLSRKVRFQSQLQLVPEIAQSLHTFIEEASEAGLLRFGNNRTRGLGGVRFLDWIPADTSSMAVSINERLQAFDNSLSQIASSNQIDLKHSTYLPVYALSDVIIRDELFRYRGRLDEQWFADEIGVEGASLSFLSASLRRVTSWNSLSGLPRADEWAIALGSVFLLGLPRKLNDSDQQRLQTLEEQGTGRRLAEGFGRIRFADPFHVEVNRV
jgi:CRISPR-associated protein Csx10